MKKLAFIGAGSHADAVLPNINHSIYRFVGYFDDKNIKERGDFPILGKTSEICDFLDKGNVDAVFITIGENQKRKELFDIVSEKHYDKIVNIISPDATILTETSIKGRGIFISARSFIGAKVKIHDNSIINTSAVVEHHTIIESHCNVCPNATVNGYGTILEGTYLGSGSVLIQMIKIAPWTMIGAGAVVVKSLDEAGTYVGVPAKMIKRGK